MKIRIKGNTLRFRITSKEAEMLVNGEIVEDKTTFPSAVLTYLLQPSETDHADFADNCIQIELTREDIEILIAKDDIGISREITTKNGNKLIILVEQDLLA